MLEWIDPDSWCAFCEMRKKLKAPMTPYAEKLIIRELVKLKASGQNPQDCLDQSIMLGWRDVFPVRDKGLSKAPQSSVWTGPTPMTPAERQASDAARKAALAAIKRVA